MGPLLAGEERPEAGGGRRLKLALIGALGALVALSNAAALAALGPAAAGWRRSRRLTLLSLAAADAALAGLVAPLNLYGGLAGAGAGAGAAPPEAYCRAVAFVSASLFGAALYALAGVSLERYVAVCFPLRHARLLGPRRLALLLAGAWLGPALLLLPVALPGRAAVLRVRFSRAALLCEPDYASNGAYAGLLAAALFCPAAATVTFANVRLWQAARAQRRRGERAGLRRLRLLQLDAASRVLVPVVVAFYVCWAPCVATILYNAITKDRVHEWLEFVALWLPSGSGFLNSFVYFWTNRNFRHKFHKLGRSLCGPCHRAEWEQDGHRMVTISAMVEKSRSQPALLPDRSCSGSSTSILLPREAQTSL